MNACSYQTPTNWEGSKLAFTLSLITELRSGHLLAKLTLMHRSKRAVGDFAIWNYCSGALLISPSFTKIILANCLCLWSRHVDVPKKEGLGSVVMSSGQVMAL